MDPASICSVNAQPPREDFAINAARRITPTKSAKKRSIPWLIASTAARRDILLEIAPPTKRDSTKKEDHASGAARSGTP